MTHEPKQQDTRPLRSTYGPHHLLGGAKWYSAASFQSCRIRSAHEAAARGCAEEAVVNSIRELLSCFDADDIGDGILLVIAIVGITAMVQGWI